MERTDLFTWQDVSAFNSNTTHPVTWQTSKLSLSSYSRWSRCCWCNAVGAPPVSSERSQKESETSERLFNHWRPNISAHINNSRYCIIMADMTQICTFWQWPRFGSFIPAWMCTQSPILLCVSAAIWIFSVVFVLIKHLLLALMQTMICEPQNSTHWSLVMLCCFLYYCQHEAVWFVWKICSSTTSKGQWTWQTQHCWNI